ncbi:hypothetical protein [Sciscionella sediminilitoris]|uniref:hypothetical protein n=1 Tax=Sciscionella sediminilitoris TaxID=1445613 RepID=UPI0006923F5F|nr:hypothetical protein [Sciscionella sp. SE31]
MGSSTITRPKREVPASTGSTMRQFGSRTQWFALIALVVGLFAYWLTHAGLTDDGYITLDYARAFATDGTWGMKPGLESNSATSPFNVLLLAALMFLTKLITGDTSPIVVLGIETVGAMVATAAWWSVISKRLGISWVSALTGLVLVLISPLALSAIGLETQVLLALLVGLFAEGLRGRPVLFGVLAGLTILTRLDSIVVVFALSLALVGVRRKWWRALVPTLIVGLPWFVTSWLTLGSAIPDTLAIKQQTHLPGGWTFATGLGLFVSSANSAVPAILALIPALLGLIALIYWAVKVRGGRLAPLAILGGAGVLYFLVYLVINPAVFLWYYVPTVALLTFFFAGALDPLAKRLSTARSTAVRAVVGLVLTIGTLIPELLHGLPWQTPPIFGNWALPTEYMRVGEDLATRLNGEGMLAPGEVGTLMFGCQCDIIDQFSDRGAAIPYLRTQVNKAGPLTKWAYELNYANLDWTKQRTPLRWRMEWHPGWITPRPDVWNVHSPGVGPGHLMLLPIDAPPTPKYFPREKVYYPQD